MCFLLYIAFIKKQRVMYMYVHVIVFPSLFSVHFFYWAITMVAISTALTIAAEQPNPHLYDQPVDIFRGICEGLAILLVTATSLTEIYNIYLYVNF